MVVCDICGQKVAKEDVLGLLAQYPTADVCPECHEKIEIRMMKVESKHLAEQVNERSQILNAMVRKG